MAHRCSPSRLLTPLLLALCLIAMPLQAGAVQVVVSFSVLGDLVERIAGDEAQVQVLVPVGAEVHDWELTPRNFMTLEAADIVFFNGLGLEQWMRQVRVTVPSGTPVIALGEQADFQTLPITIGEFQGSPDPHLWMDPRAAAAYAHVIAEGLGGLMPAQAELFAGRARALEMELVSLWQELNEALAQIPASRRLLITSEAAFLYFAAAFDLRHEAIWGSNAETQSSPRQIMRMVDLVRRERPPALFWESTVTDRHVRSVAEDTGVSIAGPLYVDSLGSPGSGAEDYFSMLRSNVMLVRSILEDQHE